MAKTRTNLKKLLAVMLALSMTMSLLSLTAFASGGGAPPTVEVGQTLILEDQDGTAGEPETVQDVGETTWTSSDETVATVDEGVVTGVSAGEAEITRISYVYLWTDPDDSTVHGYYDFDEITDENRADISPVKLTTSWSVAVTDSQSGSEQPDFGEVTDSGEGWEWYGETGTLVLTADTGNYSSSSSSVHPWQKHIPEMVSLYAKDITVGKYVVYALYNRYYPLLEDVTFEGCALSGSAFDGGSYAYMSPKLTSMTLRDCTLEANCIKNTMNLTSLVIDNCGDIPAWTFQNLGASDLDLTIVDCGTIGGGAFSGVGLNQVSITGGELGVLEEEYLGNIYYTRPFTGAWYTYGTSSMTLNGVAIPESGFEWCEMPNELILKNCTIGVSALTDAYMMPASITVENCEIGAGAFHCPNDPNTLTSLSVTGGTIGDMAFMGNVALTDPTLREVSGMGRFAFSGCDSLTAVTIQGPATVGNYAFGGCDDLTSVVLDGDVTLEQRAFAECDNITSFTIQNATRLLGTLQESVPEGAKLTIPQGITAIDSSYFSGCKALVGEIDLTGVKYIGAHAFNGCTNITRLIVDDDVQMGYSTIFPDVIDDWQSRVAGILSGSFQLDDASAIDTIAPDGWTSAQTGAENSAASYDGDTQITKEAKWSDSDRTVADVQIKAYYTAQQQMDFIFVLDCTDSMSSIADSSVDQYAKFYDMQSKMLDVSQELLSTPGYDCHVAFVGYGEKDNAEKQQYFNSGFLTSASAAESYIWDITSFQSLTNISLGLREAQALAEANTANGRATAVVFISDGTPNKNGSFTGYDDGYYGYAEAEAIKATGTQIFGVLHAMSGGRVDAQAKQVMNTICDQYFTAYDTQGFSQAVNDAIAAVYGDYVLVDTVDPDFELDAGSIRVSSGDYTLSKDADGNDVITWTISGMPFTVHTMTFRENLKQVDGAYPYGVFDTNASDAPLTCNGTQVNAVPTPFLPREEPAPVTYNLVVRYLEVGTEKVLADEYSATYVENAPYDATALSQKAINGYTLTNVTGDAVTGVMDTDKVITVWYVAQRPDNGGGGGGDYPPPTVDVPEEETPTTDLPEEETPTTDLPEEETPTTEEPVTELPEEEVPLAEVPETGDPSLIWLAASALSGSGLAWLALSERRGKRED